MWYKATALSILVLLLVGLASLVLIQHKTKKGVLLTFKTNSLCVFVHVWCHIPAPNLPMWQICSLAAITDMSSDIRKCLQMWGNGSRSEKTSSPQRFVNFIRAVLNWFQLRQQNYWKWKKRIMWEGGHGKYFQWDTFCCDSIFANRISEKCKLKVH